MANRITINMDDRIARKKLNKMITFTSDHEKELRKILRDCVKIAADAVNERIYSGAITQRTGNLGKAMGVGTFKSERGGYIGGKARPKRASSRNGGWRVHFFATPAIQMKRKYRFDFQKVYNSKTSAIRKKFTSDINRLLKKII